jgi:hypothetical protein
VRFLLELRINEELSIEDISTPLRIFALLLFCSLSLDAPAEHFDLVISQGKMTGAKPGKVLRGAGCVL